MSTRNNVKVLAIVEIALASLGILTNLFLGIFLTLISTTTFGNLVWKVLGIYPKGYFSVSLVLSLVLSIMGLFLGTRLLKFKARKGMIIFGIVAMGYSFLQVLFQLIITGTQAAFSMFSVAVNIAFYAFVIWYLQKSEVRKLFR